MTPEQTILSKVFNNPVFSLPYNKTLPLSQHYLDYRLPLGYVVSPIYGSEVNTYLFIVGSCIYLQFMDNTIEPITPSIYPYKQDDDCITIFNVSVVGNNIFVYDALVVNDNIVSTVDVVERHYLTRDWISKHPLSIRTQVVLPFEFMPQNIPRYSVDIGEWSLQPVPLFPIAYTRYVWFYRHFGVHDVHGLIFRKIHHKLTDTSIPTTENIVWLRKIVVHTYILPRNENHTISPEFSRCSFTSYHDGNVSLSLDKNINDVLWSFVDIPVDVIPHRSVLCTFQWSTVRTRWIFVSYADHCVKPTSKDFLFTIHECIKKQIDLPSMPSST